MIDPRRKCNYKRFVHFSHPSLAIHYVVSRSGRFPLHRSLSFSPSLHPDEIREPTTGARPSSSVSCGAQPFCAVKTYKITSLLYHPCPSDGMNSQIVMNHAFRRKLAASFFCSRTLVDKPNRQTTYATRFGAEDSHGHNRHDPHIKPFLTWVESGAAALRERPRRRRSRATSTAAFHEPCEVSSGPPVFAS